MEIPDPLRDAVDRAVRHSLSSALEAGGLLLTGEASAAAAVDASRSGATLLRRVIAHCYPGTQQPDRTTAVEFDGHQAATHVELALAFGLVTANVVAPRRPTDQSGDSVGLLCAVFNLGIGMIDGLCDGAPQVGLPFLDVVHALNVRDATDKNWARGQLQSALPPSLAADATVAFTARVIEAFFDMLHSVYPGDEKSPLRRRVGTHLEAALEAERQSVDHSDAVAVRDQLLECSRRTSVLPFRIIEALATGDHSHGGLTAGALLGEAMWRIDDLVDLTADARADALNGVLLSAFDSGAHRAHSPVAVALSEMLTSDAIQAAAAQAAEDLDAGLTAAGEDDRSLFLSFILRYAGIAATDDLRPRR